MNIDHIPLQYFQSDHSSTCSYCHKGKSYSLGFNIDSKLLPSTYEKLMDKGWRRCGTYYYKYTFQLNCCLSYTIRSNVLLSQQKKGQRKIAKTFLQLTQSPLLQTQLQDLKQTLKQISQEIQTQQQQKKQSKQQQQVIQQQPKQKKQNEISQEIIQILQGIFVQFLEIITKNKKEFIDSLQQYFKDKGFDINTIYEMFQLDLNIKNVKIFPSQVQNKGDYYTNLLMLIYGLNKKQLFQDFTVTQFANCLQQFTEKYFKHQDYYFLLENTGFLSIFKSENNQQAIQHQKQLEKQKQKQKIQEENDLLQQKKINIKIIDANTFKSNLFTIGNIKVVLKPAECTQENFQLYKRYCKEIHGQAKEEKSSYDSFLCQQSLQKNLVKSTIDSSQLLFIGCYHMLYYIQNILVAVGVVDITENALSSVYFFYDPLFEEYNFGTFGALVEIEYIKLMNQYFPNFKYYYLGFYLQNTNKMSYKGDFEPCELLCPETYTWVELTKNLRQIIDQRQEQKPEQRKLRISNDQTKLIQDMEKCDKEFLLQNVQLNFRGQKMKLGQIGAWSDKLISYIQEAEKRMGKELIQKIIFGL